MPKGIELEVGNAILIELNQMGSVSETLWKRSRWLTKAGYTAISSHRSGETARYNNCESCSCSEYLLELKTGTEPF